MYTLVFLINLFSFQMANSSPLDFYLSIEQAQSSAERAEIRYAKSAKETLRGFFELWFEVRISDFGQTDRDNIWRAYDRRILDKVSSPSELLVQNERSFFALRITEGLADTLFEYLILAREMEHIIMSMRAKRGQGIFSDPVESEFQRNVAIILAEWSFVHSLKSRTNFINAAKERLVIANLMLQAGSSTAKTLIEGRLRALSNWSEGASSFLESELAASESLTRESIRARLANERDQWLGRPRSGARIIPGKPLGGHGTLTDLTDLEQHIHHFRNPPPFDIKRVPAKEVPDLSLRYGIERDPFGMGKSSPYGSPFAAPRSSMRRLPDETHPVFKPEDLSFGALPVNFNLLNSGRTYKLNPISKFMEIDSHKPCVSFL